MGIDRARFRKPGIAGDVLTLNLEVVKTRGTIWAFRAEAYTDSKARCGARAHGHHSGGEATVMTVKKQRSRDRQYRDSASDGRD